MEINLTIKDLRLKAREELKAICFEISNEVLSLEVDLLLSQVLQVSREALIASGTSIIPEREIKFFNELLERRKAQEPIAYILGKKEFYSREFEVSQEVLIPRPETELLVENAVKLLAENIKSKFLVIDIGTGSGVVIISIIAELKKLCGEEFLVKGKFIATDISLEALKIAKSNAKKHGCDNLIRFIESDLLNKLDIKEDYDYVLVVSNPPYISTHEELSREVKNYEPHLALFAGEDGLGVIRRLIKESLKLLKRAPRATLLFEIGMTQAEQCIDLLQRSSFQEFSIIKDLSNRPRIIYVSHFICRYSSKERG